VAAAMNREFPNDYAEGSDLAGRRHNRLNRAHPRRQAHHALSSRRRRIRSAHRLRQRSQPQPRSHGSPRTRTRVRTAMGANRVRLFRQLLTESSLLGPSRRRPRPSPRHGRPATSLRLRSRASPRAPREVHIDLTVLLFALGIALFVSVLTGTAPAVARRENLITTLKEGGSQATRTGTRAGKLRSALIVAQVAVRFFC